MRALHSFGRTLGIDPDREVSLGETPRRMALLAAIGVVLGLIGGFSAFLIVKLVGLISNLALLHKVAFDLPNLKNYNPGPELVLVAVGGALVVALMAKWVPTIKGHGIPESLEAIIFDDSRIHPKVVVAKPISAAIAMGTGGPFGAEGPIIVTGGSAGSIIGQVLKLSAAERRIALATGAAAGMAGVFATPIAAIVIAFELLLFERSLRSLVPLLFATGVATEIHYLLLERQPLFEAFGLHAVPGSQIPLFVLLGVAAGVMAVLLNKGLFAFEALFQRLRLSEFFHPIIGAVGFASIGLLVPGSLSVGYWAIRAAVNDQFLVGAAAILMVAKLFSWWIALASNTSGGTLAPIFIIGATMGLLIGTGFEHLFPGLGIQPAAFAIVAMGATFGASSRALLTGAIFAIEATASFEILVPMLIATAVAELVTHQFLDERLMTDKLVRRGFRVEFDSVVSAFRTAVVGRVAQPLPDGPLDEDLPRLQHTAFVRDAVALFVGGSAQAIVVVEDGRPIGMLYRDVIEETLARRLEKMVPQPATLWRRSRPEEEQPEIAVGFGPRKAVSDQSPEVRDTPERSSTTDGDDPDSIAPD